MQIFLDTANLQEIQMASEFGILDGVTTNPSLMAKEGIYDPEAHYVAICNSVYGDVSAEVIATDYIGMVNEGRALAKLHQQIVVKIPMIPEGIKAIFALTQEGIRTNCTLVFSSAQALLAAKVGATYVSPFIGRLDDVAHEGISLIKDIRSIYDNYGFETLILAASLRHTQHVVQSALEGADVVTIPFNVLIGLFNHPLTDIGLEKFLADHDKLKAKASR